MLALFLVVEMPVLDGISAVRRIMAERPIPILMFSSLTHEGAKATLDALDAGAVDFLPKKFEDIARTRSDASRVLQQRVVQPIAQPRDSAPAKAGNFKLLVIGTSTGGPVALQKILTALPKNFPVPILLVQHMPAAFTGAFANRLNSLCAISVKEAEDGDVLQPGHAYLAPGGKQMLVTGRPGAAKLQIREDDSEKLTYKPSVDLTFGSVARTYGGEVLAVVLTGMGADGREGCRMLKGRGATIWAQDKDTCVVYGMPQAVSSAGLAERDLALPEIPQHILRAFER